VTLETVTRNKQPSVYGDQVRQHLQTVAGVHSVAICGWALMTPTAGATTYGGRGGWITRNPTFCRYRPAGWRHTVRERQLATLSLFFAGVALALAGVGL
jgi:hypothetical protein